MPPIVKMEEFHWLDKSPFITPEILLSKTLVDTSLKDHIYMHSWTELVNHNFDPTRRLGFICQFKL